VFAGRGERVGPDRDQANFSEGPGGGDFEVAPGAGRVLVAGDGGRFPLGDAVALGDLVADRHGAEVSAADLVPRAFGGLVSVGKVQTADGGRRAGVGLGTNLAATAEDVVKRPAGMVGQHRDGVRRGHPVQAQDLVNLFPGFHVEHADGRLRGEHGLDSAGLFVDGVGPQLD